MLGSDSCLLKIVVHLLVLGSIDVGVMTLVCECMDR